MEQETLGTQIAADIVAPSQARPASRPRLGVYLVLGFLLLVGIVIYLVVGSYIANLLQVLTNFNT